MDSHERAALRWENNLKRHALLEEMAEREADLMMHPEEWSLRAMPQPAPTPAPASSLVNRDAMMEAMGAMADVVGEQTGKLERDLRDTISTLEARITDLELRLDLLETNQNRGWFGKMKAT